MKISRAERFPKAPNVSLAELQATPVIVPRPNPFLDASRETLEAEMLERRLWRYHHNLPTLKEATYERQVHWAYVRRVDTMFAMLDDAVNKSGVNLPSASICDLACSEGFVSNRLLDQGAASIDCYELNEDQIVRLQLVQAMKKRDALKVFRTDLENPFWRSAIAKTYDLVMCLGIVYHMENPMLFFRNVYELTGRACIVESDTPVIKSEKADDSLIRLVDQQVMKGPDQYRYILEARPSAKALADMLLCAGFSSVEIIAPPKNGDCPYLGSGAKSVMLATR